MSTQDLRDRNGSLIGKVVTKSDGKQEIYDRFGSIHGKYDPKTNKTYDRRGSLVGTGNLLTTLL